MLELSLMVRALAGTGKTTTATFGLGRAVPKGMVLSKEQLDIVKLMRGIEWNSCAAQAYNRSIAAELKDRVPSGVEAATSNAFGYRAWLAFTGKSRIKVDGLKNRRILQDLVGKSMSWKERQVIEGPIDTLVSLCKNYLMKPTDENLAWLCDRFDIDAEQEVLDYTIDVFNEGVKMNEYFDFNDQNFMPIWHDIPLPQYDLVVVDEVQDLTKAKQEMAFRMAKKALICVGDEHQAIYGFSGADADSMSNMESRMKEVSTSFESLPLTITRRCPKRIVQEANKYVPALRAAPEAPDGTITTISERERVEQFVKDPEGHMVLCRANAPLTSLAFKLIGKGRRTFIQGRDIGTGIKREVSRVDEIDITKALSKVQENIEKKIDTEQRKKFPMDSKVEMLRDRLECILVLSVGVDTIKEFENKVDMLFKDEGQPTDIQLSSVHKAKGLEHPRVTIIRPHMLPMKKRKKPGQRNPAFQEQQEKNLTYVAYTRSMDSLTFATSEDKGENYRDELIVGSEHEMAYEE